ncbi:MAG: DUF3987 domain-containing protein, partial [Pseudomonadota bacterium]
MTQAQVKAEFTNAETFIPEPPKPLRRPLAKPEDFPIEAMGELLSNAAKGIHDKIQSPLAMSCQSVLATASLAAQTHCNVKLPNDQIRPLSNYFITIAGTGERKTASDNEATKPVAERERQLEASYDSDKVTWKNKNDAYEKQRQNILADKVAYKTKESMSDALDALGEPPSPPLMPLLTCPEPTFEGMCRLLLGGLPSIGIFSNEGGQFVGGHGMNQENK